MDSSITNCGQCNILFIAFYKLDDHLATGYKLNIGPEFCVRGCDIA